MDAHTGERFFRIAGACNTAWMNEFLKQLSEAYPHDDIVLVMDHAVWHKSKTLVIPVTIEVTFIPPYTPGMNPIEQVWAEIRKRGFKNRVFKTLEEVIDKLQEVIQGLHWPVLKSIVRRKWIDFYFGCLISISRMKQGRQTTFEERVEIVNFTIAHDKNYQAAIEKYNVSYQQVYSWVRKFEKEGSLGLLDRRGKGLESKLNLTPEEELKLKIK